MAPRLEGHELVAHLFVAVDGPDAHSGYAHLRGVWERVGAVLRIDQPLGARCTDLPVAPPEAAGVIAARSAAASVGGRHQAVVRRLDGVICLSVVRASGSASPQWDTFDAEWTSTLRVPVGGVAGVLGAVRILQAYQTDSVPIDGAALGPAVRADAFVAGDWWRAGMVRSVPGLGSIALWESTDPIHDQHLRDGRADRRLIVVAALTARPLLSSWTWARGGGDPRLPGFAAYLHHAAAMRYELRLLIGMSSMAGQQARVDRGIAELLPLADALAANMEPSSEALRNAENRLFELQAAELRLTDRMSRLRGLRTAAASAAMAMGSHSGGQGDGLFAEDRDVAAWLDRQIDRRTAAIEAVIERARATAAIADQIVQRGRAGRQARFNLGLTGTIAAVLMVLAAIQSFQYAVPLGEDVQPAVIAALGALALLFYMIVLWTAAPRSRVSRLAVISSAGLFAAAVAWTIVATVASGTGGRPEVGTAVAWAAAASVAGALAGARVLRTG